MIFLAAAAVVAAAIPMLPTSWMRGIEPERPEPIIVPGTVLNSGGVTVFYPPTVIYR